jgi:Protein kinase domain
MHARARAGLRRQGRHNHVMPSVREVLAGRYELLDVLGRGGMGVVYRARDQVLDREVAVKLLASDLAEDPTFVARFEREARAAARLSHPGIVSVFDTGHDGDTRFIVMECLHGSTLARLLHQGGALAPERAAEVAAAIAGALAAAHREGIVHRDIKPGNVMIDDSGLVKVLDFGIARAIASTTLTQPAAVVGSAPYLAPELARGARADARSDIYALGCVLYAMLTGRPPFTGELAASVMHQHGSRTPRPPREQNPATPAALDALVMRMLAKRPADRPQSADELAQMLAACVRDRLTPATVSEGPRGRAEAPATDATRRLYRAPVAGSRRRWALVALALLALACALLVLLWPSSGSTQRGSAARGAAHSASARAPASAAKHRPPPRSPASASARTATPATAPTAPPAPASVRDAAAQLAALVQQGVQAATVDGHAGRKMLARLGDVLASYEGASAADALPAAVGLAAEAQRYGERGAIQPAASAGLNGAIANLRSALGRAAPPARGAADETPAAGAHRQGSGDHKGAAGAGGEGGD